MVKAHDKLAKNSEKLMKNMEKVRKKLIFGQNRLGKDWFGGEEKARKVRRKSLEWGFARKSGGQYGVSKLRGWRKEFYCEFRWRIFSHGWHEYTTRVLIPTECTEHTETPAEKGLPRMARICTDVWVLSRGCSSLCCTNQTATHPHRIHGTHGTFC